MTVSTSSHPLLWAYPSSHRSSRPVRLSSRSLGSHSFSQEAFATVRASLHCTPDPASRFSLPARSTGDKRQNGKLVLHLGDNPSSNTAAMNFLLPPMTGTYCLANTGHWHSLLAQRNRWQLPPLVCTVISHSQPTSNVVVNPGRSFPILVNGCTGKMGKAVAESALSAGLQLVPVSFSSIEKPGRIIKAGSTEIQIHGPSERESLLSSIIQENPDIIVVDYTVPDAVNANADLYCKLGVPFVMGTTGGDRHMLYKTVQDANVYAVISPQMGKQVVAFLAAMEIMADQFPGAFSGYSLEVMESHQASKLDTSGTAKAVISCFQKLGVNFNLNQIKQIRDPKKQVEMVGVPEEYLAGHAFHLYHLTSPDQTVSFEFQHNVCGRSIYAEGSVDAAIFLHEKVKSKSEKRIYDMVDVLREGNMR